MLADFAVVGHVDKVVFWNCPIDSAILDVVYFMVKLEGNVITEARHITTLIA